MTDLKWIVQSHQPVLALVGLRFLFYFPPTEASKNKVEVGSHVTFGSYEQDNSGEKKAIEWVVLDKADDKALLISRYGLDAVPFNTECKNITWEKSSLRNWLNSTFIIQAFTSEQQKRILTTSVSADLSDNL